MSDVKHHFGSDMPFDRHMAYAAVALRAGKWLDKYHVTCLKTKEFTTRGTVTFRCDAYTHSSQGRMLHFDMGFTYGPRTGSGTSVWLLLSPSVHLPSALHCSDFGSARYGLVRATGRQSKCSPVKKHSATRCSLHGYAAHCSYCARDGENLFWKVVLIRACAEHVRLPPLRPPSARRQEKWLGQ
jgi:hypothetical protein